MAPSVVEFIKYFNDGVSDSGILFILVLVDTTLAISYNIKLNKGISSGKLLSGLFRNIILSFMPLLVQLLSSVRPRTDDVYQTLACILTVMIGYGIIQSIMAYISLLGFKYPKWLLDWLDTEITEKDGTKDNGNNLQNNKNEK